MSVFSSFYKTSLVLFATAALYGCQSTGDELPEEQVPSYEQLRATALEFHTGAIYRSGVEMALYEDVKARRVGDILTVLLVEQTSGQNSMDNSINQSTGLNIDTPILGGATDPDFNYELSTDRAFEGQSGTSQSNRLNGSISVTVHEVLANGNLVVQGEKRIRINKANEFIRLQGVVRPKDIGTNNTLLSTQVADARISYGGRGTNSQSNSPGWVSRILFSPIWPF